MAYIRQDPDLVLPRGAPISLIPRVTARPSRRETISFVTTNIDENSMMTLVQTAIFSESITNIVHVVATGVISTQILSAREISTGHWYTVILSESATISDYAGPGWENDFNIETEEWMTSLYRHSDNTMISQEGGWDIYDDNPVPRRVLPENYPSSTDEAYTDGACIDEADIDEAFSDGSLTDKINAFLGTMARSLGEVFSNLNNGSTLSRRHSY